jgi:phospholipid/cholesterol/gamma-HCH transport system substrate-binding protein
VKVSNETKVGAIAIVAICLLILGFNFLKGNRVLSKSMTLYGNFANVQGLTASNPVFVSGMQVGRVSSIDPAKNLRSIRVSLEIDKDVDIPSNSIAVIKPNPITNTSIEIILGDAVSPLKDKDTINTEASQGILEEISKEVNPVLAVVKKAAGSLDSLVNNLNSTLNPDSKNNVAASLQHIEKITASLQISALGLESILQKDNGSLAETMDHVNSVTGNLEQNNERINKILINLDSASGKLATLDLHPVMDALNESIRDLQKAIGKFSSGDGTAGKIMNDPALYENLVKSSIKLNTLLDDIRINPKRYLSLFGGKKKAPLKEPVSDSKSGEKSNQ